MGDLVDFFALQRCKVRLLRENSCARHGTAEVWTWPTIVLKIPEYQKATSHSGVQISSQGVGDLAAFADATFASYKTDLRSVSGGVNAGGGQCLGFLYSSVVLVLAHVRRSMFPSRPALRRYHFQGMSLVSCCLVSRVRR